ncbi:MAG: hypothetical protein K6B54_06410 [Clostridia bacterium]|nr:hypothetical protein [Clostridia bacterium]
MNKNFTKISAIICIAVSAVMLFVLFFAPVVTVTIPGDENKITNEKHSYSFSLFDIFTNFPDAWKMVGIRFSKAPVDEEEAKNQLAGISAKEQELAAFICDSYVLSQKSSVKTFSPETVEQSVEDNNSWFGETFAVLCCITFLASLVLLIVLMLRFLMTVVQVASSIKKDLSCDLMLDNFLSIIKFALASYLIILLALSPVGTVTPHVGGTMILAVAFAFIIFRMYLDSRKPLENKELRTSQKILQTATSVLYVLYVPLFVIYGFMIKPFFSKGNFISVVQANGYNGNLISIAASLVWLSGFFFLFLVNTVISRMQTNSFVMPSVKVIAAASVLYIAAFVLAILSGFFKYIAVYAVIFLVLQLAVIAITVFGQVKLKKHAHTEKELRA